MLSADRKSLHSAETSETTVPGSDGSFQKLGVPYLGGPYNKDPTIEGTCGSPIFGNPQMLKHTTQHDNPPQTAQ